MTTIGARSLSTGLRLLTDLLLLLNILALVLLPVLLPEIYRNPAVLAPFDGPGLLPRRTAATASAQPAPGSSAASQPAASLPAAAYPSDVPPDSYPFYLGFLLATGIGTAWVLGEGHFILRRLERGQPFAAGHAASFRRMAIAFALLTLAFAVKVLFYNTLLTIFCTLLFVVLLVICLIFADIFHQAWLVKTENELTI